MKKELTIKEAGAMGGKKTAKNRTKKQRSEAARVASVARWSRETVKRIKKWPQKECSTDQ